MSEPSAEPDQGPDERITRIAEAQPPFANWLGIELVSYRPDEVVARLRVEPHHGNRNGMLHGGAVMAFADNLGGTAASLNLPAGAATTTLESKTNFIRAVRLGDTVTGTCVPLHRGRTTSVWQTTLTDERGRTVAIVTQTQITLHR